MNNEDLFESDNDMSTSSTVGGVVESHIQNDATIVKGKITFEKLLGGVRVTARDDSNKTLWGFVASKKMIEEHYSPVGLHTTLKDMIREELKKHNLPSETDSQVVELAKKELKVMQSNLDKCKKSIDVLKVSEATRKKAKILYKALHDANTLLELDMEQMNIRQ